MRLLLLLLIISTAPAQRVDYTLSKPDERWQLPPQLHEISGITEIDDNTIACVQDELGVIFFLDLKQQNIRRELSFGYNGDYEGITRVGNSLYVLRSDGLLYEISDLRENEPSVKSYDSGVPTYNNEGLCLDSLNHRLLIGAKSKLDKGPDISQRRFVFGFSLADKRLQTQPVFEFDNRQLSAYAINRKIIPPTRTKKNGKSTSNSLRLNTSEIAIHPITHDVYVLSASSHLLLIVNIEGEIKKMEKLDPAIFNKPEGITFLRNGDMLVTNEGQEGFPSLVRFNYRAK